MEKPAGKGCPRCHVGSRHPDTARRRRPPAPCRGRELPGRVPAAPRASGPTCWPCTASPASSTTSATRATGDRLAELDWAEAELDRAFAGAADAPASSSASHRPSPALPAGARARSATSSRRTAATRTVTDATPRGTTCWRYCGLSAEPGRAARARRASARPRPSGWPGPTTVCTGAPAGRAPAGRRRGRPAAAACTCPQDDLGRPRLPGGRPGAAVGLAGLRAAWSSTSRPTGPRPARRGRAARPQPPRPAALGRRRLRGRRPRRPRRHRAGRQRRARACRPTKRRTVPALTCSAGSSSAAPRRRTGRRAMDDRRRPTPRCGTITASRGEELRLRHQAAAARPARRHVGPLRDGPAHRRHRRRRRPARREARRARPGRARPGTLGPTGGADADDAVLVALADAGDALPDPARARSTSSSTAASMDVARLRVRRRSTTSCGYCRLRRRLDRAAVARRLRHRGPGVGRARAPTASASPCSSRTSCATSIEDRGMGRVYLPGRRPAGARLRADLVGPAARRWPRSSRFEVRPGPGLVRRAAWSCCPCSTAAAGRAWRPWPASTAGCSARIERDPGRRARGRGVAPDAGEGCGSPPAASPVGACMTDGPRVVVVGRWPGRDQRRARRSPTPAPRSRCSNGGRTARRGDVVVPAAAACWFDNGQHVFLRCCTSYRAFLERIGAAEPRDAPGPPRRARPGAAARRTAGSAARHCRRRSTSAPRLARYRHLRRPTACGSAGRRSRCARVDPADPALDTRDVRRLARAGTASRDAAIEPAVGPHRPPTREPAGAATPRSPWPPRCSRPVCSTDADAADIGWSRRAARPAARRRRPVAALGRAGVEVRTGAAVDAVGRR